MITILSGLFIKKENESERRSAYGILCSITGICLNIFLFLLKFIAGYISGSVAITADAFNNLSDAGSSVVALLGFWFAGKEPDAEHPFGHGRYEYIAGFVVSIAIFLMGLELLQNSVIRIFHPEDVDTSVFAFVILGISILTKIYMAYYNDRIGKRINSSSMLAVAKDSLSDVAATSVVLISMVVLRFAGINMDGYGGVIVAVFILYAGYEAARDTIDPLLGLPPDPEFVKQVEDIVLSHDMIIGIHDLIVHDYGPDSRMISLHAEVPGDRNMFEVHDLIDHIEHELKEVLTCDSVIHMDPVRMNDENVEMVKKEVLKRIREDIHGDISIHDFRMAECEGYTNLIFDVVVPYEVRLKEKDIRKRIEDIVDNLSVKGAINEKPGCGSDDIRGNDGIEHERTVNREIKYHAIVDIDRFEVL